MTKITFFKKEDKYINVTIQGHSMFQESGSDIICAGISSIVFGTMNALDKNNFKGKINIDKKENKISILEIAIKEQQIIDTMFWQLKTIEDKYKKNIIIKTLKGV